MSEPPSFGAWMQRRRKALDLTQHALAQLVGCSVVSIRKFENETQRPSRQLAQRLAEQLQIAPEQQAEFIQFARFGLDRSTPDLPLPDALRALPRRPAPRDRASRLPAPYTTLVGRTTEIDAACALLRQPDVQLLTMIGPGGVGKTRLAITVAAALEVARDFADGVWSINLAPIRDPALAVDVIAQALGVQETSDLPRITNLCAFLADKQLLLLLDNCEQVAAVGPLLADICAAAPRIKILVTSRAPLALSHERVFAVLPLTLPMHGPERSQVEITASPAVRLFVERSQAAYPEFTLTDENAPIIAEICRRLDGLPLAIELAAARSRLLAPELLLDRLGQRLPLLTGGARDLPERQQTLRNTIAWGYDLLDPGIQMLFRRLAVFAGGWTLELAESVCNRDGALAVDVLHGLAALLEQNLICQAPGLANMPRFTMLETIQEFAAERLRASGEDEALQQAHAQTMLDLGERAARAATADQLAWFARLELESDNLRAALEQGSLEVVARLSVALTDFWALRDRHYEGERWLEVVLQRGDQLPRRVQAQVRAALGRLLHRRRDRANTREQRNIARIIALLEASLLDFRALGDLRAVADVLIRMGEALNQQRQVDAADAAFAESLAIAQELRDQRLMVWAQHGLAMVAEHHGDHLRASALATECLALFRAMGDTHGCAFALLVLAQALAATGNLAGAEQRQAERLAYERELGHQEGVAITLMALAGLAMQQGKAGESAAHLMESLQLWRELGARQRVAETVGRLAEVAAAQGCSERAARLRAAATVLHDRASAAVPAEAAPHDITFDRLLREALAE